MTTEYNITSVVEKCMELGFNSKELQGTEVLWWYTYDHVNRFVTKPTDPLRLLFYQECRARECYKMCEIRIQRIVDSWHEEKLEYKQEEHVAARREYDDS